MLGSYVPAGSDDSSVDLEDVIRGGRNLWELSTIMFIDNTKGRKGEDTNLSTDEGDLLSILADDEEASAVLVVQQFRT